MTRKHPHQVDVVCLLTMPLLCPPGHSHSSEEGQHWPCRVSQSALLRLPCGSSWREFWGTTVFGLPPCPRSSVQPGRSSCHPVTSPESFSWLMVITSFLRASALCQPFYWALSSGASMMLVTPYL